MMEARSEGAETLYRRSRIEHWDTVARQMDCWKGWGGYYHQRLADIYKLLIAPGQRVLELGCAQGDLLSSLRPSRGVGVDFSGEMLSRAIRRHPEIEFVRADVHQLALNRPFDVIILSDLLNDLWDVQTVFRRLAPLCTLRTRIIMNFYSRLWELPLMVAERFGWAKPVLFQNWLTVEDVAGLLKLEDFETIRHWEEILLPLHVPALTTLSNRWLVKIWPFSVGALTHFVLARPSAKGC